MTPSIPQGILWNPLEGFTPEETHERLEWQAERSSFMRIGVSVLRSGSWQPRRIDNDWTPGRSPKKLGKIAKDYGIKFLLCGLRHNKGGPNGWGTESEPPYHRAQPVMNPNIIYRWWNEACSWLVQENIPVAPWMQDSNEFAYLPNVPQGEYESTLHRFMEGTARMQEAVRHHFPAMLFCSPGTSGGRFKRGNKETFNYFAASRDQYRGLFDFYDIHFNNMDADAREHSLTFLPQEFGVDMICLEARDRQLRDNRADVFAAECQQHGCAAVTAFGHRRHERWGTTRPGHPNTNKAIVLGPEFLWHGENARRFTDAALLLGYEVSEPPIEPPIDPPGDDLQPLASFTRRTLEMERDAPGIPSIDDLLADPEWRRRAVRAGLVG